MSGLCLLWIPVFALCNDCLSLVGIAVDTGLSFCALGLAWQ